MCGGFRDGKDHLEKGSAAMWWQLSLFVDLISFLFIELSVPTEAEKEMLANVFIPFTSSHPQLTSSDHLCSLDSHTNSFSWKEILKQKLVKHFKTSSWLIIQLKWLLGQFIWWEWRSMVMSTYMSRLLNLSLTQTCHPEWCLWREAWLLIPLSSLAKDCSLLTFLAPFCLTNPRISCDEFFHSQCQCVTW